MNSDYAIIAFTDNWGSHHGGVNAFNYDFVRALDEYYNGVADIYCVVNNCTRKAKQEEKGVTLISLGLDCSEVTLSDESLEYIATKIGSNKHTYCVGHDIISGEAAIVAAEALGGKSVLIHHMSYDGYKSVEKNSESAVIKKNKQIEIFSKGDHLFAIGPKLVTSLKDLTNNQREVNEIIPGLVDCNPVEIPTSQKSLFISGRLDAGIIKQGMLAIAGFCSYIKNQSPRNPAGYKIYAIGAKNNDDDDEREIQNKAEEYAGRVVNIQTLPYTTDRDALFKELASKSLAAMPSWHEGFGLSAWEAISAEVPLIITLSSGVYELLEKCSLEREVQVIDVLATLYPPYFVEKDLKNFTDAVSLILNNEEKEKRRAKKLKKILLEEYRFSWTTCAYKFMEDIIDGCEDIEWKRNHEKVETMALGKLAGKKLAPRIKDWVTDKLSELDYGIHTEEWVLPEQGGEPMVPEMETKLIVFWLEV